MINFWFASCKPCLLEFNALNKLYDQLVWNEKFQFISLTYEKPEIINEIKKKYNLNFEIISVSYEEFSGLLQGFGCPVNVIVNKEGMVKYWKSGGEVSEERAIDFILNKIYLKILEEI